MSLKLEINCAHHGKRLDYIMGRDESLSELIELLESGFCQGPQYSARTLRRLSLAKARERGRLVKAGV